jgi:hypothetical protein
MPATSAGMTAVLAVPAQPLLNTHMQGGWVYINKRDGILYVGVTSDLPRRVYEHRAGLVPGFTKRYGLKQSRPLRTLRHHHCGHPARENDQALVARLESTTNPRRKSAMGRPVRQPDLIELTINGSTAARRSHRRLSCSVVDGRNKPGHGGANIRSACVLKTSWFAH